MAWLGIPGIEICRLPNSREVRSPLMTKPGIFSTNRLCRRSRILGKATEFQPLDQEILTRAEEIEATMKIKGMDALHLACAEALGVDYFITCDDRMIKKYQGEIALKTPTDFANRAI